MTQQEEVIQFYTSIYSDSLVNIDLGWPPKKTKNRGIALCAGMIFSNDIFKSAGSALFSFNELF